jgi:hypothetical protein
LGSVWRVSLPRSQSVQAHAHSAIKLPAAPPAGFGRRWSRAQGTHTQHLDLLHRNASPPLNSTFHLYSGPCPVV